jgi:maleate cis-trans isomerase
MMFEDTLPKLKIGALKPLSVVDNSAYEFYRIAPPGVMLVMIPVGLGKFSKDDVERVFAPIDGYVDQLMERGCDLIMQSGVPLPLLIGVEAHDRLLERIEKRSGKPATSSVLGVISAAKHLGLRKIVVANKWSQPMNRTLGEFFARVGTEIVGVAAEVLDPDQFQKIATADHMRAWNPIPGHGKLLTST